MTSVYSKDGGSRGNSNVQVEMAEGGAKEVDFPFEVIELNSTTKTEITEVDQKQMTSEPESVAATVEKYVQKPAKHSLSIFAGVLALVSTCVGGGIVGLPRAFYYLGIPLAIVINFIVIIAMFYSVRLYLATKDVCPNKPESLYEIAYLVMGRKAIFMLGWVYFIASAGMCMIYFVTFGDTMGQLVATFCEEHIQLDSIWYTSRYFYILVLAGFLVPVILKKELAELKVVSVILFLCLGLFILLSFVQLTFDDRFNAAPHDTDLWYPKMDDPETLGALQITTLAYAYQQNLFQIFGSMKVKTNANYQKMNFIGLLTTLSIYVAVAIISLFMFGSAIEKSVLKNIGEEQEVQGMTFWEGYVLQVSFCVVLICHIPFIFFAGKEGLLIMIDETNRKSTSKSLRQKLETNPQDSQQTINQVTEETVESTVTPQEEESNKNAYLTMKTSHYIFATLAYYIIIVIGASTLSDINLVFDFVGAIAISAIAFLFPGYLFIGAVKKFDVPLKGSMKTNLRLAYLFIFVGIFLTILGIYSTIYAIVTSDE